MDFSDQSAFSVFGWRIDKNGRQGHTRHMLLCSVMCTPTRITCTPHLKIFPCTPPDGENTTCRDREA